jgi:hypothetical protein
LVRRENDEAGGLAQLIARAEPLGVPWVFFFQADESSRSTSIWRSAPGKAILSLGTRSSPRMSVGQQRLRFCGSGVSSSSTLSLEDGDPGVMIRWEAHRRGLGGWETTGRVFRWMALSGEEVAARDDIGEEVPNWRVPGKASWSESMPPPKSSGLRGSKRHKDEVVIRGQRFQKRRPPPAAEWSRDQGRWSMTWKGPWRYTEHTNVQEYRTISLLARKLSLDARCWNSKVLVFSDSTSALGALAKGRSSAPAMIRISRQLASISLGLGIRLFGRYVRSEENWSDGPSRGLGIGVADGTATAHSDRALALVRALQDEAGLSG